MKIISKRYKCKGTVLDNKPAIEIDHESAEVVPNDEEDSELEANMDNITKLAQDINSKNERTKSLKAKILKNGEEGTITLKYLV